MLAVGQDLLDVPFYLVLSPEGIKETGRAGGRVGTQPPQSELGYFRLTGLTSVQWVTAHTTAHSQRPPLARGRGEHIAGPAEAHASLRRTHRKADAA